MSFFSSSQVFGQVIELSAQDYSALILKGQNLDIKISEAPGTSIKIMGVSDKNHWMLKNSNGKRLLIEEILKENKKDLMSDLNSQKQKILIQMPSLPVQVSGYKVDLLVENLKKDFKVTSAFGVLKFIKTIGELQVSLVNGDIAVETHTGKMIFDGEQLKLNVQNSLSDGEFKVQNLKLSMDKTQGNQQIFAYNGQVNLNQNSGSFFLEMSKGTLGAFTNQGRFEASLDDVNTQVRLSKENELILKAKTGRIFVNTNNVSGIWLNLKSDEGDIYLPGALKSYKNKQESSFKGRTPGDKTLTRIEVKSINAPIVIK